MSTNTDMEIKRGRITDFEILDFHNVVGGTKAEIFPKKARIAYYSDTDLNMTKKFWLEFEPIDASGVTWGYTPADCDLEDTGIEVIDGTYYFTCVVTPKKKCTTTITGTLLGDTNPPTSSATLIAGDFIDLGQGVLWARSLLTGASKADGLKLEDSPIICTGIYKWGDQTVENEYLGWWDLNTGVAVWTIDELVGDWNGTNGTKWRYGGRYNGVADAPYGLNRTLIAEDDAATLCNGNWHMADKVDYTTLESITTHHFVQRKGVSCWKYDSNVKFFTDVYLLKPISGGTSYHGEFVRGTLQCSEMSRQLDDACTGIYYWTNYWTHNVNNVCHPFLVEGYSARSTREWIALPIRPVADRDVAEANDF